MKERVSVDVTRQIVNDDDQVGLGKGERRGVRLSNAPAAMQLRPKTLPQCGTTVSSREVGPLHSPCNLQHLLRHITSSWRGGELVGGYLLSVCPIGAAISSAKKKRPIGR